MILSSTRRGNSSHAAREPIDLVLCVGRELAAHVRTEELVDAFLAVYQVFFALQAREYSAKATVLAVKATTHWSAYIALPARQVILQHHLVRTDSVHVAPGHGRKASHLIGHRLLVKACSIAPRTHKLHWADKKVLVWPPFAGVYPQSIHVVRLH